MANKLLVEMQSVLDHLAKHPPEQSSNFMLLGTELISHDHSGRQFSHHEIEGRLVS
jgi:hypothetical protein